MLSGVPCHHGMARPQVADRGDGLHIWRVAANILNKQSRTTNREWPSRLGVRRGAINPPQKICIFVANYVQGPQKWTDSLARPKYRKVSIRFGTWNIRILYRQAH
jgi:hypothetical protein